MPTPPDALARWWSAAPGGRALDLGAGTGEAAVFLAQQGFLVDAIERDPEALEGLRRVRAGRTIVVHPVDLRTFPLISDTYALVLASAVLHFLRPSELWPLADLLAASLVHGGVLVAEVLTADDPELLALRAASVPEVEPNTFAIDPPDSVIHFFEAGELRRVFAGLEELEYAEDRRAAETEAGYRSGATLVARRRA